MSIRCASKSANLIQKSQALLSRVVLKDEAIKNKITFSITIKSFSFLAIDLSGIIS